MGARAQVFAGLLLAASLLDAAYRHLSAKARRAVDALLAGDAPTALCNLT